MTLGTPGDPDPDSHPQEAPAMDADGEPQRGLLCDRAGGSPELLGKWWEVELRALMGLRARPGGGAGTLSRGTGEPWQVCEQGRGRINAKGRKMHLGPRHREGEGGTGQARRGQRE